MHLHLYGLDHCAPVLLGQLPTVASCLRSAEANATRGAQAARPIARLAKKAEEACMHAERNHSWLFLLITDSSIIVVPRVFFSFFNFATSKR